MGNFERILQRFVPGILVGTLWAAGLLPALGAAAGLAGLVSDLPQPLRLRATSEALTMQVIRRWVFITMSAL